MVPRLSPRRATMRLAVRAALICLLFAVPVGTQQPSEKLGTVNFPTSCSPLAQAEFVQAVALLHSFWFTPAIKGFEAAAKADPSCGIAYWGTAMTLLGKRWPEA